MQESNHKIFSILEPRFQSSTQALDLHIPALKVDIAALIMKDSPNALSIGKLVKESGLGFHWIPERPEGPFFRLPDGTVVEMWR